MKEIEVVDLVDANGQIQMRKVPRSEIGQYPDLHLQIVIAYIFNNCGEVLVQRRALSKSTCAGYIDCVCGAITTGENPNDAAQREGLEETGLALKNLKVVSQGINTYGRYRFIVSGRANGEPNSLNPQEVEWVRFISPKELRAMRHTGKFIFVDEFFEDLEIALSDLTVV